MAEWQPITDTFNHDLLCCITAHHPQVWRWSACQLLSSPNYSLFTSGLKIQTVFVWVGGFVSVCVCVCVRVCVIGQSQWFMVIISVFNLCMFIVFELRLLLIILQLHSLPFSSHILSVYPVIKFIVIFSDYMLI